MTRRIEVTAKTVDEAVEKALQEFNTTRENVDVYVVEEGSKGIFGFGAKDAKVRVSFDEEKIENVKISISAEDISILEYMPQDMWQREHPDFAIPKAESNFLQ